MNGHFIIANWKANGSRQSLLQWHQELVEAQLSLDVLAQIAVCPPLTLLSEASRLLSPLGIALGAQSVSSDDEGAHTGEITASMLKDAGASMVLIGHSERRQERDETDADTALQVEHAIAAGLQPVLCVGETAEERSAGQGMRRLHQQLGVVLDALATSQCRELRLAYEPIWAIGSGNPATPEDADRVCHELRDQATKRGFTVLTFYGGSVNADNAREFADTPHIDGVLVGGASLQASSFAELATAFCRSPQ